jgi:hypothetical protein
MQRAYARCVHDVFCSCHCIPVEATSPHLPCREVPPRERKPPVYAFSPLHTPLDVVTNIGGRVGWDNLPLPGPLFPMP